jgi:hypothetical protein
MQKPKDQWPQIAMINEVWYTNGDRYVHPSFEYAATGFLIDTGKDTLAATVKHVLWVAKTKTLKVVDVNPVLKKWLMHPKNNLKDSVVVDRLINTDTTEVLRGAGSTIQQRDWIIFSTKYVSPNIQPLKPRYTSLAVGETVYYFGCPYDEKNCIQGEGKVVQSKGGEILFTKLENAKIGGASGSPVVDKNGFLVGIVSGSATAKTGEMSMLALSTYYLKKVLDGIQPLNEPLIQIGEVLMPVILNDGLDAALKKFEAMKKDKNNFFIYDFSPTSLNPLATNLLKAGKTDLAKAILKLSLKEYRWTGSTYTDLARAYC